MMRTKNSTKTVLEYIWIGGKGEIRSKTRVFHNILPFNIDCISEWNYDGSSTWQADSDGDTEILLKPCAIYRDPIRNIPNCLCYIILCDTYNSNGKPTLSNHRHLANKIFEKCQEHEPWFGLEQEYFIILPGQNKVDSFGKHYCGQVDNKLERIIAEEHMTACIQSELNISGINSEVAEFQWEFQIGPCEGIQAGDQLVVARYLLERIAEKYGAIINYHPKPNQVINGSGCHINFSTIQTRIKDGIEEINRCINCLSKNHSDIIKVYGNNNNLRLTGRHETSQYDKFSYGIGTRNTSIRIPNQVVREKCGYFEDRRPASNIDPYLATSSLCKYCYIEVDNK